MGTGEDKRDFAAAVREKPLTPLAQSPVRIS